MATQACRLSDAASEKPNVCSFGTNLRSQVSVPPDSLDVPLTIRSEQDTHEFMVSEREFVLSGHKRREHKVSAATTFMEVRGSSEQYKTEHAPPLSPEIKVYVKHSAVSEVAGACGGMKGPSEEEEAGERCLLKDGVGPVEESCESMPDDSGSRRRFGVWATWEGGAVGSQISDVDKVVVGEADSESDDRMSQRSRFDSLREQLSQLEEVAALQNVKEVGAQAEIVRLRETNGRLVAQMAVMRESVARLESEKRALNSRLGATKNAMQQLEREALIRSGVQLDMAAATSPEAAKGWLSWGTKDKVAEASSIAEEARVQNAAARAIVEKLLHENAELADQLNDQSALLERLARTYGNLANLPVWDGRPIETSDVEQERVPCTIDDAGPSETESADAEMLLKTESLAADSRSMSRPVVDTREAVGGVRGEDGPRVSTERILRDHHPVSMPVDLPSVAELTREEQSVGGVALRATQSSVAAGLPYFPKEGPKGVRLGVVTSPRGVNQGSGAWLNNEFSGSGRPHVMNLRQSSYGSHASWDAKAFPSSPRAKKRLGAVPVLAIPLRLVQLLAQYVAGADLVEKYGSV